MLKNNLKNAVDNIKTNKYLRNRKVVCFGAGALAILTGGITLTGCSNNTKQNSIDSSIVDTTTDVNTTINDEIVITTNDEKIVVTTDDNQVTTTVVEETPVYVNITAEDVVTLSNSYAEYLNKEAVLSHENYEFDKIEASDLYSVVYLANIDNISKEETEKLIETGLLNENIHKTIANAFYFYNLYMTDTINKINEGKTNLIDLSLILTDENDIETFKTMNKIMVDSITNTEEENFKNYKDTAYYYAMDAIIDNEYDFSKSIYKTDRDKLTVGGNYTLSFVASTIDYISYNNGVATNELSNILQNGANDFANVVRVFNGCKTDAEETKQYTK